MSARSLAFTEFLKNQPFVHLSIATYFLLRNNAGITWGEIYEYLGTNGVVKFSEMNQNELGNFKTNVLAGSWRRTRQFCILTLKGFIYLDDTWAERNGADLAPRDAKPSRTTQLFKLSKDKNGKVDKRGMHEADWIVDGDNWRLFLKLFFELKSGLPLPPPEYSATLAGYVKQTSKRPLSDIPPPIYEPKRRSLRLSKSAKTSDISKIAPSTLFDPLALALVLFDRSTVSSPVELEESSSFSVASLPPFSISTISTSIYGVDLSIPIPERYLSIYERIGESGRLYLPFKYVDSTPKDKFDLQKKLKKSARYFHPDKCAIHATASNQAMLELEAVQRFCAKFLYVSKYVTDSTLQDEADAQLFRELWLKLESITLLCHTDGFDKFWNAFIKF